MKLFFYLLLLPLILYGQTVLAIKETQEEEAHFTFKCERRFQIQDFKETRATAREILDLHDQRLNTAYLNTMDSLVRDAARLAENAVDASRLISFEPKNPERFATLEEIYDKLYEPSFRAFQMKQRPCRRYEGTYMEHRYGWEREYKGSHPRGNLSTPDYQVARAKKRRQEMERQLDEMLRSFVSLAFGLRCFSNYMQCLFTIILKLCKKRILWYNTHNGKKGGDKRQ